MKIIFICKNNQFRSQMAAAIYNKLSGTSDADSAGTYVGSPAVPENTTIEQYFRLPDFFEMMEERALPIRTNLTKKLSPEMLDAADVVISMAQEPFIPDFLRDNKKVVWWEVIDPPLVTREVAEETFAQIKGLVEELVSSTSQR